MKQDCENNFLRPRAMEALQHADLLRRWSSRQKADGPGKQKVGRNPPESRRRQSGGIQCSSRQALDTQKHGKLAGGFDGRMACGFPDSREYQQRLKHKDQREMENSWGVRNKAMPNCFILQCLRHNPSADSFQAKARLHRN